MLCKIVFDLANYHWKPPLHTHVVVANKVQTVRDGQWRAIDSRVL